MTLDAIGKIKPEPLLVKECLPERAQTLPVADFLAQAGTKALVRVVCVDDNYQRTDTYDMPDGLLERGRIYFVSGRSECGGLMLAGIRAISYRTGNEVGFDPSRFHALGPSEKFSRHYRRVPENLGFVNDEPAFNPNPIALPTITGLLEMKPLINQAIEVIESACVPEYNPAPDDDMKKVREELLPLLRSPNLYLYMNQSWVFWQRLIRYQKPTVLFCRNYSPVATTLFQMCMSGNILTEAFLDGNFKESDFPVLTSAAGRLSFSPIRICDAREPDTFLRVLSDARKAFEYAMCDWTLAGEEAAAAHRLMQDSPITFLCPFGGEMETEDSFPCQHHKAVEQEDASVKRASELLAQKMSLRSSAL
jgi:hypothetical protein